MKSSGTGRPPPPGRGPFPPRLGPLPRPPELVKIGEGYEGRAADRPRPVAEAGGDAWRSVGASVCECEGARESVCVRGGRRRRQIEEVDRPLGPLRVVARTRCVRGGGGTRSVGRPCDASDAGRRRSYRSARGGEWGGAGQLQTTAAAGDWTITPSGRGGTGYPKRRTPWPSVTRPPFRPDSGPRGTLSIKKRQLLKDVSPEWGGPTVINGPAWRVGWWPILRGVWRRPCGRVCERVTWGPGECRGILEDSEGESGA